MVDMKDCSEKSIELSNSQIDQQNKSEEKIYSDSACVVFDIDNAFTFKIHASLDVVTTEKKFLS